MRRNAVVTGIGLITALNPFKDTDKFWEAACSGENAIQRTSLPMLDIDRKWLMAAIDTSLCEGGIQGNAYPENKLHMLAEEALNMAMRDTELQEDVIIGLSLGTVLGNILLKEKRLIQNKIVNSTHMNEKESLSYITSFLQKKYHLTGEGITVSTACSSGTDAIGIAARKIMAGKADAMIAGGVDVLSDFAIIGFHSLQALTEKRVQPFDKNRSGLALGEGAAFIVLEAEEKAVSRGARIYGKVLGYASRADAHHLTGPHRDGRGLADAIHQTLSQAGLTPQNIDYINAHGTGTVYNDLMETKAIKAAFGKAAYDIPISSTKSMLGHSFGAAGVIEAICCLLSMKTNVVHPTINYEEKDPACDLDYVPNNSRQWEVKRSMSLSAGFGGQNAAIVFGET